MTSVWHPELSGQRIRERFEKGASLWLLESEGQLACYSWTIKGRAIDGYYFPLGSDDVQLFDFYVFPKFRGRAVLWILLAEILQALRAEGAARVFGDVAEWNQPSLSFYKMTPFRLLGMVRTYRILGQVIIRWSSSEPPELVEKGITRRGRAMKVIGSNK
jgi:ribosomal protein S18 acetylase RimI-like enzyme